MRIWLWLALAACSAGATETAARIKWSAPVELARGGGQKGPWQQNESKYDYVDDPSVAVAANGTAALAWVDNKRKDIFFQTFADGRLRGSAVNVSRTPEVFSWLPRVAFSPRDPKHIYVLWQEIVFSGGTHGGEIFFARSRDGGASFDAPVNLSNSRNGDGKARLDAKTWLNGSLDLAVDARGTLYAAWTEYDGALWFARSTNGGESFSKPLLVDAGKDKPARAPALATGDNLIYLAWTVGEDQRADVRLATSRDGTSFGTPVVVARTGGYSDAPKLGVDRRGTLHVVYAESDRWLEPGHVRYLRSSDRGRTFTAARELSGRDAGYPSLTLDERDRIFVTWELYPDRGQPRGLAIAYSTDGGATFSAAEDVEGSTDPAGGRNGSHQGPLMKKLAVRAGNVAVVNSALKPGSGSRVWLLRGRLP